MGARIYNPSLLPLTFYPDFSATLELLSSIRLYTVSSICLVYILIERILKKINIERVGLNN